MTHRRRTALQLIVVATLASASLVARQAPARHFPAAGKWEAREPAALGLDKTRLDEAIAFAVANQNPNTRDLAVDIPNSFRNEAPYNTVIGPTQARAESNGVIIRHGYVAAEWGDTPRADMTFSVTKTFLTTVVGLAFDRGLIKSVDDRVAPYMPAGVDLFTSPHNSPITWNHLLRQTSDWSGELWGKPDWADRPARGVPAADWPKREMHEPGTFYKYNDTRVNVMALAALYVLKQPLPDVLKASIMDPIGASSSWHWEGYDNSWVTIDGRKMKSVTGGGHFGGGMFINAFDMARFGYLFLNRGKWNGRQLVSEKWIGMARMPGTAANSAAEAYGFANWFLNAGKKMYPNAPEGVVAFRGNGENVIYIDWDNDLVVVVRWIQSRMAGEFFTKVLAALR